MHQQDVFLSEGLFAYVAFERTVRVPVPLELKGCQAAVSFPMHHRLIVTAQLTLTHEAQTTSMTLVLTDRICIGAIIYVLGPILAAILRETVNLLAVRRFYLPTWVIFTSIRTINGPIYRFCLHLTLIL